MSAWIHRLPANELCLPDLYLSQREARNKIVIVGCCFHGGNVQQKNQLISDTTETLEQTLAMFLTEIADIWMLILMGDCLEMRTIAFAIALYTASALSSSTLAADPVCARHPAPPAPGATVGCAFRSWPGGPDGPPPWNLGPSGKGLLHGSAGPEPRIHWPPLFLAEKLAAMETLLGIRVEQLNAWRNFTDALQALMQPPPMPPYPKTREALATTAIMGADLVEKGKRAEAVIAAVNKLYPVLTPEQIERTKSAKPVLLTVLTP